MKFFKHSLVRVFNWSGTFFFYILNFLRLKVHYSGWKFYFKCFDFMSKDRWIEMKLGGNVDDFLLHFPNFLLQPYVALRMKQ